MRKRFRFLLCGVVLLSGIHLAAASVRLLSGQILDGKVEVGASGITVTDKGGSPVSVDLFGVLDATFKKGAQPAGAYQPGVVLLNGSGIADKAPAAWLENPTPTLGKEKITVPVNSVAWLVVGPCPREKLLSAPAGQSGAILAGGDFFPGTFTGISKGKVAMNSVIFGPQLFEPKQKALLAVALRDLKLSPTRFEVVTVQGSRFLVDDVRFEGGTIVLKDSIVGDVRIKGDDLVQIQAGSGRYYKLAEQKPLSVNPPPGLDANTAVNFGKGADDSSGVASLVVTAAANAAISYAIPPGYTSFTCGIAVRKDAPPGARISFAVYGDGLLLSRSPPSGIADKPLPLRFTLGAARVLTLKIEPVGSAAKVFGEWTDPTLLH